MTRIVSYVRPYKRPPRKRKAVALDVPAVATTKRSRRPTGKAAAQVIPRSPRGTDGQRNPAHRAIRNVTAP
jgi:hypothetical protein